MTRQHLIALGGIAAALGGLAWLAKAAAILATGVQPPLLFDVAPGLLAVGLIALFLRLETRTRLGTAGLVLVVIALAAWTVSIVAPVGDGEFSPAILISTLGLVAGLIVIGVPVRRNASLGAGLASSLPLWLGIGMLPALAVGGALEAIDERLLEVPVAVVGSLWAYLGVATARVDRSAVD